MVSLTAQTARAARIAGALALQYAQPRESARVLFNSFNGQFSDNPRAIYEELARRDSARPSAFVTDFKDHGRPPHIRPVAMHSWSFLRELGRSGHVVSNVPMPRNFVKRRAVTYLQTWHGTPLKLIGYDNPRWRVNPAGLKTFEAEVGRWDYLVSPNRFSSDVFRRAFRTFRGELLETGYPRNDALKAPDCDAVRERIRRELRIPAGARAVLYAPTWRDDLVSQDAARGFRLELDIAQLRRRLGDQHVLLLRLHYALAAEMADVADGWVRNVSAHPDIRELYLAADVLITDYSSVMFDWAVTGKPMVFFAYDLERYRDELRGFYFDLEREAAGPVCRSSDEVASVLADLDATSRAFAERYRGFRERFCHLDDGQAAARVVDRVFARA